LCPKYNVWSELYFLLNIADNGFKKVIDIRPITKNEIKAGVVIFHKEIPKVLDII
jgi:hypothetical protein